MNIITKTWLRERDLISYEAKRKWAVEKKIQKRFGLLGFQNCMRIDCLSP